MFTFRDEDWAPPVDSPAYPRPPFHYEQMTWQMVHFRADSGQMQALLPEPLKADPQGRCCAFTMDVGFCAQLGPFRDVGVVVGCELEGRFGYFQVAHFVNTPETIAAGREIYGSPKKFADITMIEQGGELTTTAVRADVTVVQINSRLVEPAEADDVPSLFPLYKLKTIPSATGGGPDVKQLLCGGEPSNMKVDRLFKGPGVVSFSPTVAGEFWQLLPLEFEIAIYQRCSCHQGLSEIAVTY